MSDDLDQGGSIRQLVRTYVGPTGGWIMTDRPVDIEFVIAGGGSAIASGFKGSLLIPEYLLIDSWVVITDTPATIQINVYRISQVQAAAGLVPSVANAITGTDIPRITAGTYGVGGPKSQLPNSLPGWNRRIEQNDILGFNVDSNNFAFRATIILKCVAIIGQYSGVQPQP